MLRVGLTGGLGSGKSTVAALLEAEGAGVLSADEVGRRLMEPGQRVYAAIVAHFGAEVVAANGELDRKRLAALAFGAGRVEELNKIVHPPVLEEQALWFARLFASDPNAVGVVESALIFEVARDSGRGMEQIRERLDCILVVTAPIELRIERYVRRVSPAGWSEAAAADAKARIARQIPDEEKAAQADFVVDNSSTLDALKARVAVLFQTLKEESNRRANSASVQ